MIYVHNNECLFHDWDRTSGIKLSNVLEPLFLKWGSPETKKLGFQLANWDNDEGIQFSGYLILVPEGDTLIPERRLEINDVSNAILNTITYRQKTYALTHSEESNGVPASSFEYIFLKAVAKGITLDEFEAQLKLRGARVWRPDLKALRKRFDETPESEFLKII